MATEQENGEKMLLWLAKNSGPLCVVGLYDGWETYLAKNGADRTAIAHRLRVMATKIERGE